MGTQSRTEREDYQATADPALNEEPIAPRR